eukprot:5697461-Alexandrium_andersonii.AAC.1
MPPSTASYSPPGRTRLARSAGQPRALRASPSLRGRCWRTLGTALVSMSWRGLSGRRAVCALP